MKNSSIRSLFLVLVIGFIVSCEGTQNDEIIGTNLDKASIEVRDSGECDICIEEDACCCYFELTPGANDPGTYNFEICGVQANTHENMFCSLSTENGPCYTFGNLGVSFSLDPSGQTRQWFCIPHDGAFAIQFLNTTGVARTRVACSSNGVFSSTTGLYFTYYGAGSGLYLHYLLLDGCDETDCSI